MINSRTFDSDCSLINTTVNSSWVAGGTLILKGIIVGKTVYCQSLGGHRSPRVLQTIYCNAYWDIINVLHPLYAVDFRANHSARYCDTSTNPTSDACTSGNYQCT